MAKTMDNNQREPESVDPELGTERRTPIGGWWRDLFTGRVALAVMVLLWVAFLLWVLWKLWPD